MELAKKSRQRLTKSQIDALKGKIERHAQAVSVPVEIHRIGITNSNPENKNTLGIYKVLRKTRAETIEKT
ncbi:hypothetical protein [Pseudomonas asiatica]|uniref:hypothetical protein n=1 Tax=Pseudomonas asiatica TaxID=2219225 RepID=UPI0032EBC602